MDSGSAIPSTSRDSFYRLLVAVPPLKEQQAIATILGALDDKIDLNRRMNETLEEIARAFFRSWFVDFGPVRAKAEGREPYGMDSETASLFPSTFQPSELGNIPLDWQVAPLTAHVEILGGGTPKTSVAEFWGGGIPWVSVVDTVPGPYIIQTAKTVSETAVARGAAKMLPAETVVLTARGTVGNSALIGSTNVDEPVLLWSSGQGRCWAGVPSAAHPGSGGPTQGFFPRIGIRYHHDPDPQWPPSGMARHALYGSL